LSKLLLPQLLNRDDKSFKNHPYHKDDLMEVDGIKFIIVGKKIHKILNLTDDDTTNSHMFPIYKYAIDAKNVKKLKVFGNE